MNETDNISFSTDKSKLNIDLIVRYLHNESYWAKERPEETIRKSIKNSLCIGIYCGEVQIGFARIVSDFATVYYLADIFIIPAYQNRGIGHRLMDFIDNIEGLKNIRGILTTQTAHSFYKKFGFTQDNEIVQQRMMTK